MNMKEFLAELNEIEATEAEVAERKSKIENNRAAIVAEIKELVCSLSIAPSELFAADALSGKQRKTHTPVQVKYRSPTGDEWSGRGMTPRWLNGMIAQGRSKEEFAVTQ